MRRSDFDLKGDTGIKFAAASYRSVSQLLIDAAPTDVVDRHPNMTVRRRGTASIDPNDFAIFMGESRVGKWMTLKAVIEVVHREWLRNGDEND
jgi:hypothetical protein